MPRRAVFQRRQGGVRIPAARSCSARIPAALGTTTRSFPADLRLRDAEFQLPSVSQRGPTRYSSVAFQLLIVERRGHSTLTIAADAKIEVVDDCDDSSCGEPKSLKVTSLSFNKTPRYLFKVKSTIQTKVVEAEVEAKDVSKDKR